MTALRARGALSGRRRSWCSRRPGAVAVRAQNLSAYGYARDTTPHLSRFAEEGTTFDCSVVIVPENHAEPGERTVELVVMRLRATTLSPMPDPLVYLSAHTHRGFWALHRGLDARPLVNATPVMQLTSVVFPEPLTPTTEMI